MSKQEIFVGASQPSPGEATLRPDAASLARAMFWAGAMSFCREVGEVEAGPTRLWLDHGAVVTTAGLFRRTTAAFSVTLGSTDWVEQASPAASPGDAPRTTPEYFLAAASPREACYVGAVAVRFGLPILEREGTRILGRHMAGDKVVVLCEHIGSGSYAAEVMKAYTDEGIVVAGVTALIDHASDGRRGRAFKASEVGVASAMTLAGIAQLALDEGLGGMTPDLHQEMFDSIKSPS